MYFKLKILMKNFTLLALCAFLFTAVSLVAQPTMAPTAPTKAAADVVSILGNTYTPLASNFTPAVPAVAINFYPDWGQGTTFAEFPVAGNPIKKYGALDYQGIDFGGSLNVSSMTTMHWDIWTDVATTIDIYLIASGAGERSVKKTTVVGWNSFDIPLTEYTSQSSFPVSSIFQFKFVEDPMVYRGGTKTVYLYNIYFWKPANVPTLTGFSVPAKLVGDAPFALTAPTSPSSGAFTYQSSNTSVATISGSTVTIVGAGTSTITANQAAAGAYAAGSTTATLVVTSPGPQTAAPTPTKLAANVTSLFSNAYTNVTVDTWSTVWDNADVADVMIAGNATKKYTNHTFSGTEFIGVNGVNLINASAIPDATKERTHIHMDVWTADAAGMDGFKVKLVDFGANGIYQGTPNDDSESIELPFSPTASGWFSVDAPLSSFTGLTNKAHLAQLVLVTPGGSKTFWLDNVYLYTVPVTGPTAPLTAAPNPTKLPANVISLFSGVYTDLAATDWFPNWGQSTVVTDEPIAGNTTKKFTNLNYQGTQFATAINLTAAGMTTMHFDYWSSTVNSFDVFLINILPLTQAEQKFTITPTLAGWNSIDIPLTVFNTINLTGIGQIKWEGRPSSGTVYLDNIYFWKPPVAAPTAPLTAAPDPTKLPANVISLFSGVYTNLTSTDWFPNWGQSTVVTDEIIVGNATKKLTNLNYQGTQFANPIDLMAANMTTFHIDYWSASVNSFDVFLINIPPSTPKEQKVTVTPTLLGWNSIDIPLVSYNTLDLSGIGQIKWEGRPAGGNVFLDNIYFWKPAAIPVEMTLFKGKAVNNTSVLTWQTASERDNKGFSIERSNDATNYTAIGEVKGNGTTASVHDYTFTDATPLSGVNYYRLRQTDVNGKETMSKVVTVLSAKSGLFIKNTLVHDVLDVTVGDASKGPLSIFNISGQLVYSTTVSGSQQINLSALTAGVYIIRTTTGEAMRFVKD
jgi:hypothetical protein